MGVWDSVAGMFGARPAAAAAAAQLGPQPIPTPDLRPFDREKVGMGGLGLNAAQVVMLAGAAMGRFGEQTRPQDVPWYVLDCMAYDPWIYLGESAFAAPLRDPTLYYVHHSDPAIKAEAEMVLAIVAARTLRVGTRAIALGCAPWVYDWVSEDLQIVVQKKDADPRNKNLAGHQHYDRVIHDMHPGEVELEVRGDRLIALRYGRERFLADRAFCAVWDQQFGRWEGCGSRRRAYRAYFRGDWRELWQDRWLERSVDPPRIGRAPNGLMEINGEQVRASDVMASALMALKGGGTAIFPNSVDKDTKVPNWAVEPMELPDVSDVWHKSINQTSSEKLIASMVPPSTAGVSDTTFAGAKVPYDMFVELLESAAEWVASDVLQPVLTAVHRVNHGDKIRPPEVRALEVPRLKVKRLTEIFKSVASVPRRVGDKEVTLAELLDETILDEIGLERRPTADAARDPRTGAPAGGPPPGRPRNELGDREERRESSPSDEGQEDTGGDNVDRNERGE